MANIQSVIEKIIIDNKNNSICPNCKRVNLVLDDEISVPLKISLLFFKITVTLNIKVQYCYNCGYLKIEILT